jgi:hypothetical protein
VAYRWRRASNSLSLDFTGSGARATLRLLLPDATSQVALVSLDGWPQPIRIDQVFGSRYVVVQTEQGSGRLEVVW